MAHRGAARAAFALAVGVAAAGCNQIFGLDPADRTDAAVDASIDADEDSTTDASLGEWNTAVPIPNFQTANAEEDPHITDDGLELYVGYYGVASPTGYDIVVSRRVADNQPWPPPVRVMELSTNVQDVGPRITDQDRVMYFATDRPGGAGMLDVLKSMRSSNVVAWSLPAVVPDIALNTAASDRTASPCLAQTRFIFASTRNSNQADLFELVNGTATAIPVASSNAFLELAPFVTEDCLTVYFTSNLTGTFDLYVMSRVSLAAEFSPPARIDELSTTTSNEYDPWVSRDGHHIVFASDRAGTPDLYEAYRE